MSRMQQDYDEMRAADRAAYDRGVRDTLARLAEAPVFCTFCNGGGMVVTGVNGEGFDRKPCRSCSGDGAAPFARELPRVYRDVAAALAPREETEAYYLAPWLVALVAERDPLREALKGARERLEQCQRDRTERDKVFAQSQSGINEINAVLQETRQC